MSLSFFLSGATSKGPRKQSGFTLIELMVVMAIIAILATAGLSAYTGYIKKARDATRIEDLRAINTIIIANMSTSGTYPTISELRDSILAMNNNQPLLDPMNLGPGLEGKEVCLTYTGSPPSLTKYTIPCNYFYITYNGRTTYRLGAFLESESNWSLLTGRLSPQDANSPSVGHARIATDIGDSCNGINPYGDGGKRQFVIENCSPNDSADVSDWENYML